MTTRRNFLTGLAAATVAGRLTRPLAHGGYFRTFRNDGGIFTELNVSESCVAARIMEANRVLAGFRKMMVETTAVPVEYLS